MSCVMRNTCTNLAIVWMLPALSGQVTLPGPAWRDNVIDYSNVTLYTTAISGSRGNSKKRFQDPAKLAAIASEIKAVIDRVLDQRIQRAPLPPGVLASVHVRHINEWDVNGTGQTMDGAPRRIDVTFGKTATGVVFSVEIE